MKNHNTRNDWSEWLDRILTILIIVSPGIIAYYFCRDYKGRGNSPENAPMAAVVTSFIWLPFYLGIKELFKKQRLQLNLFFLTVYLFIIYQVTFNNPKF